jgi:dephospho-CoA kinase
MHADISERIDAMIEGHSARLAEEKAVMVSEPVSAKNGTERENETLPGKRGGQEGTRRETVFLVAPLLFEAGLDRKCDRIWLVAAEEGLRLRRAAMRDGTVEAAIRRRAAHQWAESERRARADVILENDGDIPALYEKVDRLLEAEREGLCW